MYRLMMRSLAASSLVLFLASCHKQAYPDVKQRADNKVNALYRKQTDIQPVFDKMLYRCTVDGKTFLKSYHLSGILFLKNQEDGSTNVVFQNEMGISYFDFSWSKNNIFKVNSIIAQMNKEALIKTLRKDFEMLLVKLPNKYAGGVYYYNNKKDTAYVQYNLAKGFVNYLIDDNHQMLGIENADEKQKVVRFLFAPTPLRQLPDSLRIEHLRANFTIDLKKMPQENVAE